MDDEYLPFGEKIKYGGTDSVLAALYRKILDDIHLRDVSAFENLLVKYINKTYRNISNIKEQTSVKSNIRKELLKTKMSLKVFIKGLRVLNIRRFELLIRIEHANRTVTQHSLPVIDSFDMVDFEDINAKSIEAEGSDTDNTGDHRESNTENDR
jgi:hypothetical protein